MATIEKYADDALSRRDAAMRAHEVQTKSEALSLFAVAKRIDDTILMREVQAVMSERGWIEVQGG